MALMVGMTLVGIRRTAQRARAAHDAVHPGMALAQVQGVVKGRHIFSCRLERDGEFVSCTVEELREALAVAGSRGRASIHVLGPTPRRFTFVVEFGADGKVASKTAIRGWD